MLSKEVEDKLQLFIYILQSLRLEERSQEEIMTSLTDYGMNQKDIKDLWAFYLSLEEQWRLGVKAFLKQGYMSEEIEYQIEGMSEPFFRHLCEKEKCKQEKTPDGFLSKFSKIFKRKK